MSTLPRFIFPSPLQEEGHLDSESSLGTTPSTSIGSKLQLNTQIAITGSQGFSIPRHRISRPELARTVSSPPDSPTRSRASTTGTSNDLRAVMAMLHDSGAITPPSTPMNLTPSHSKSGSASSVASLRCGDSISSVGSRRTRAVSVEESERPGSTEVRLFKHWITDYNVGEKGKEKVIGSGLWSDVYLATPILPKSTSTSTSAPTNPEMTPPLTPVKSRSSSFGKRISAQLDVSELSVGPPAAYAIKMPASKSAKQVLGEEARILSYLSLFPGAERYIVPFYGQDTRTGALVLQAMDTALDSWIQNELNALQEPARSKRLSTVFPSMALHLVKGLEWMGYHSCIHADVKPSNILLSASSPPLTQRAVYSDFSSAIATHSLLDSSHTDVKLSAPLGGGTWDFLDPMLLVKTSAPVSPSAESDLWSLAITLLYMVIGASPFDCAGSNIFRRREMIKHGTPMAYAAYGDDGPRSIKRMDTLSQELGFDVKAWFGKVLNKDVSKRLDVASWRAELEAVPARAGDISKV